MNAEQRELFRLALLRVLDANNTRHGLTGKALVHLVIVYGFKPTELEVDEAIRYLQGKGFVEEVTKKVSPENRAFRITAEGVDFISAQ